MKIDFYREVAKSAKNTKEEQKREGSKFIFLSSLCALRDFAVKILWATNPYNVTSR